ncbi:MAG: ABC transporter substrate-binding protein [Clostridia bacterium]|nr:ABC transporter substrate-binding protein [Clostridia bacterium]
MIFLLLSVCLFLSCGTDSTEPAGWFSFTDDAGETVVLDAQPKTVAVLTSSFAEIWSLAGGTVSVTVGETVERGFADADCILVDAGAGKTISIETLIGAEPDLVIASADIPAQAQAVSLLADAGIPAAQLRVESFDDYLRILELFTQITENAEAYRQYGQDVQAEIDAVLAQAAEKGEGKKILFVRAGSSSKSTKAKTAAEHFACAMLKELGTRNIAENAPVLIDGLSMEEILLENPAYLFISTMGDEDAAKANMNALLAEPAWQEVDAVKNGRVFYLPKELFQYKPNERWAEAYRMLCDLLYEN